MKFLAQIKTISIKQLVSGDTSVDITIRKDRPSKELLNHLNEINKPSGAVVTLESDV